MIEDGDEIIVLDDEKKPKVIYRGRRTFILKDGELVEVLVEEQKKKKGKSSGKAGDTGN